MDDYLTIFETDLNGGKKFESAQSRFDRLHVPRSEQQWILCDFCGSVVNKILYNNHIASHEMIEIIYELDHFEIAEQKKRAQLIQQIQKKEEERQLRQQRQGMYSGSSGPKSSSSCSSSSSSSSSSSQSSTDSESEILAEDNKQRNGKLRNATRKGQKKSGTNNIKRINLATKGKKRSNNKIQNTSKKNIVRRKPVPKMLKEDSVVHLAKNAEVTRKIAQMGLEEEEAESDFEMVDVVTYEESDFELVDVVTTHEQGKNPEEDAMEVEMEEKEEKEGKKKKMEGKQRKKQDQKKKKKAKRPKMDRWRFEQALKRKNLGPSYYKVYVDVKSSSEYFDFRTNHVKMEMLEPSPPKRRRSRRGRNGLLEDGNDPELHCLV